MPLTRVKKTSCTSERNERNERNKRGSDNFTLSNEHTVGCQLYFENLTERTQCTVETKIYAGREFGESRQQMNEKDSELAKRSRGCSREKADK